MKFFGTDGIRMKADDLLHTNYAYKLGVILSSFSDRIGIGKDARTSSSALERQLVQGVLDGGKTAVLFGVLPTPSLSLIMNKYGVEYSVMVTASHNPPEYNGLKIIKNGGKLTLDEEMRIDEMMTANFVSCYGGNVEVVDDGFSTYKKLVKSKFPDLYGNGEKIYLDCANGADAEYARRIFESFGFDVLAYNDVRDGRKVNVGCGATNIDFLKSKANGNIGFAFDGDGDRLIAVDNDEVIDGDGIIYALAKSYLADNKLNSNTV
ncbi:MAG: phosphoglucosamine mutase, partial [Clostridia bacterium]|nr:phosphoglucosamine mutase [Clostridia bacterium]